MISSMTWGDRTDYYKKGLNLSNKIPQFRSGYIISKVQKTPVQARDFNIIWDVSLAEVPTLNEEGYLNFNWLNFCFESSPEWK